MKKLIFPALLASSTLLVLESPVLARDCPLLNVAEITVQDPDPNNPIKLRTDPKEKEQTIPNSKETKAVIDNNNTLITATTHKPVFNEKDSFCYYAVKLTKENNPKNTKQEVLDFSPYWISEKGIKDYATLTKADATPASPSHSPSPPPGGGGPTGGGNSLLLKILAWSVIPILIAGILIWAFLHKEKLFAELQSMFNRGDDEPTRSRGSRQGTTRRTGQQGYPPNHIQEPELPDNLTRLIIATDNVQYEVDRNTGHVKNVEALLTTQNQLIQQNNQFIQQNNQLLEQMVELLQGDRRSPQNFPPVTTENQKQGLLFGGNEFPIDPIIHSDSQPLPPRLSDVFHQINDLFYNDVINKFKASDSYWFWSQINSRKLRKVQVTKNSVEGEIDMGGKITKLELDEENGTLLVYEAANKWWLIPNPVEPKWKRAVTESLFTGTSGTSLVRPAEVEALGNNMWQVKEKGEFQP